MKKIISGLTITMLLLITGCANKEVNEYDYSYIGVNEEWTVIYKVKGTSTSTEKKGITEYDINKECRFKYNKDIAELSSVKHLELSYKSSVSAESIIEDYKAGEQPEKTYKIVPTDTDGGIEREDEVIEVTINIDGNIQTIQLKNQK